MSRDVSITEVPGWVWQLFYVFVASLLGGVWGASSSYSWLRSKIRDFEDRLSKHDKRVERLEEEVRNEARRLCDRVDANHAAVMKAIQDILMRMTLKGHAAD